MLQESFVDTISTQYCEKFRSTCFNLSLPDLKALTFSLKKQSKESLLCVAEEARNIRVFLHRN